MESDDLHQKWFRVRDRNAMEVVDDLGDRDYFRTADQIVQNRIFTLPRTPFAQVS
jgi:hypothetical protein